jgi:hypothetical protein
MALTSVTPPSKASSSAFVTICRACSQPAVELLSCTLCKRTDVEHQVCEGCKGVCDAADCRNEPFHVVCPTISARRASKRPIGAPERATTFEQCDFCFGKRCHTCRGGEPLLRCCECRKRSCATCTIDQRGVELRVLSEGCGGDSSGSDIDEVLSSYAPQRALACPHTRMLRKKHTGTRLSQPNPQVQEPPVRTPVRKLLCDGCTKLLKFGIPSSPSDEDEPRAPDSRQMELRREVGVEMDEEWNEPWRVAKVAKVGHALADTGCGGGGIGGEGGGGAGGDEGNQVEEMGGHDDTNSYARPRSSPTEIPFPRFQHTRQHSHQHTHQHTPLAPLDRYDHSIMGQPHGLSATIVCGDLNGVMQQIRMGVSPTEEGAWRGKTPLQVCGTVLAHHGTGPCIHVHVHVCACM